MPIITLTTDLGTRDHYVGVVKGELLRSISDATIIDISNEIDPFNILHGSYVLKNSYRHFPEGTYHIAGVNLLHDSNLRHLIIDHENYFFVGPDNGFFALIWNEVMPSSIYAIELSEEEKFSTLPLKDSYVRVISHLCKGGKPEEVATKINAYRPGFLGRPIIQQDFIKGSIVYFDRFENAIVNITKQEFEQQRKGRKFVVYFKRYDDIDLISDHYADVPESEKLCLFNSSGYLEIAINKGNAMGLLNLSIGDIVQVEFK